MASCLQRVPGPYGLKTLVGYEDHDPCKRREPAYTMKFRHPPRKPISAPGPYKIQDGMTQHGPYYSPAQTMQFKPKSKRTGATPGPGAYAPEKYNHLRNAAAYSMVFKHGKHIQSVGPGPAYMLPTCIGPIIPDIKAAGACVMTFKHKKQTSALGPGPAAYHASLDVYKKTCPAYSMKFRHKQLDRKIGPGPQYFVPLDVYKKHEPEHVIGIKYSPCVNVGFMEKDDWD